MFLNTTNAFNVGLEYPTHCVDMFVFKFTPNSSLGDFLPALLGSSVVLFLHSCGSPFCTGVFYATVDSRSTTILR